MIRMSEKFRPVSFIKKFVDEMGRTYSGNLILQELITVNGAYKATYIDELSSN